jgi:hypothetical protein
LAKNPDDRQQNAEELSDELRNSSHQIFIPLAITGPEAEAQYDLIDGAAVSPGPGEHEETAESNLRLVKRRRRRFAVAAAAALVAVIAAAALWGLPSASSRRNPADVSANVVAAPSLSPEAAPAIGSDPDSLELAARTPAQNNNAGGASTPGAQATPGSTQQTQPTLDSARQAQAANPAAPNNKAVAQTATLPTPSPAPAPIPPRAQPQMPPAPSPDIALKRSQQLASEPDLSQGPVKERDGGRQRRENDSAIGDPDPGQSGDMDRESDRNYEYNPPRRRNNDTFNRRRMPDPPNRDAGNRDGANDYQDDSGSVGPKLYQWSGRVNNEREITIELPGVPGTVEIPRAYRDRVGVIEPPSANNRWSCVVLRILGRGGVSFVIRWWPSARKA